MSKISSGSYRCQPAGIKLQEIFIFSALHRIPPILHTLLKWFIKYNTWEKELTMKSTKNDIERRMCCQKSDAHHKNSSAQFFL